MSTGDAEHQAKDLADLLTRSGLSGVRVNGDVVSYPIADGHVLLRVLSAPHARPAVESTAP